MKQFNQRWVLQIDRREALRGVCSAVLLWDGAESGGDGPAVVLGGAERGWVCRLPECGARRGR